MSEARRGVTFALGAETPTPDDEMSDAQGSGFMGPNTFSSPAHKANVRASSKKDQFNPGNISFEARSSLRRRSMGAPSPIRYNPKDIKEEDDDDEEEEEVEESGSEEEDSEEEDSEEEDSEDQDSEEEDDKEEEGEEEDEEEDPAPFQKRFKKANIATPITFARESPSSSARKPFKKVFIPPPEPSDTDEPVEPTIETTFRTAFKPKRKQIVSPIVYPGSPPPIQQSSGPYEIEDLPDPVYDSDGELVSPSSSENGSDYEESIQKPQRTRKSPQKPPLQSSPERKLRRGRPEMPALGVDPVTELPEPMNIDTPGVTSSAKRKRKTPVQGKPLVSKKDKPEKPAPKPRGRKRTAASLPAMPESLPEVLSEVQAAPVTPQGAGRLPPPATDKPTTTNFRDWDASSSPFLENPDIGLGSLEELPSSPVPLSNASFKSLVDENTQMSGQIMHFESENEKFVGLAEVLGELAFTSADQPISEIEEVRLTLAKIDHPAAEALDYLIEELLLKRTELTQARASEGKSWIQLQELKDENDDLETKIEAQEQVIRKLIKPQVAAEEETSTIKPTSKPRTKPKRTGVSTTHTQRRGQRHSGGGDTAEADFNRTLAALQADFIDLVPGTEFADQRGESLTHQIALLRAREALRVSQSQLATAATDHEQTLGARDTEIARLNALVASGGGGSENCRDVRVRLREAQRQLDTFKQFPEDMNLNIALVTDDNIVAQWDQIYADIVTLCSVNYSVRTGFRNYSYTESSVRAELTSVYLRDVTLRQRTGHQRINSADKRGPHDYRTQVSIGIFYRILVEEIFNPIHYMLTLRFQDPSQRWKRKKQLTYAYESDDFFRHQTQSWFQERRSWVDRKLDFHSDSRVENPETPGFRKRIRPNFNYFRTIENTQLADSGDIRSILVLRAKLMHAIFTASEDSLGDKSKELRESVSALIRDTLRPFRLQPGPVEDAGPDVLTNGALKFAIWNILKRAYLLALNISFQPTVIFAHNDEILSMMYFNAAIMRDADAAEGLTAGELLAHHTALETASRANVRMETSLKVDVILRPTLSKKGIQEGALFDIRGWTTLSPAVVVVAPVPVEPWDDYDIPDPAFPAPTAA